jgi:hypothetical protein
MLFCSWLAIVAVSAAEPAASVAPQPLAQVPLDIYRLRDWGNPSYDIYLAYTDKHRIEDVAITEREMKFVATQKYFTQVKDDEILMRQYWIEPSLKRGGAVITYHCRKDALLSLARMEVQRDAKTYAVDVTDGEFDLEFMGKTRSGKFPANTVTDAALMRLVTLLPREPGKSYAFGHRTATPEINVLSGENAIIHCHGPETYEQGDVAHACTKFSCGEILLWVRDRDSRLMRYEVPGWKILLLRE